MATSCSNSGGAKADLQSLAPIDPSPLPPAVISLMGLSVTEGILVAETTDQALWLVEEGDEICSAIATRVVAIDKDDRPLAELPEVAIQASQSCGPVEYTLENGEWAVDLSARVIGLWFIPPSSYWDGDWEFVAGTNFDSRLTEAARTPMAIVFHADTAKFGDEVVVVNFTIRQSGGDRLEWSDEVQLWDG